MESSILIVEDDELQQTMLATLIHRKLDFKTQIAGNGREALGVLEKNGEFIRLVILDLDMPVMGGMETLEIMQQQCPAIPVLMLTGSHDIDDAVKALKLGATDFINKPYQAERMITTIRNALKLGMLSKEVKRLSTQKEGTFTFESLIGCEKGLAKSVGLGRKAAVSNIPVLITGETGTGKEVFAKAIHGHSNRSGAPFIAVNCGAIPSQLVESTLFGHEKGAFTGATDKVIGKFREAEGGTIFLDEVGELPLDTQVKLLRVLQQKEVEPVGAGKPVPVNVRILSATNRDLRQEIKNGTFREDLFFRLNVLELELPALRNRRKDILLLADHFMDRYCAMHGALPKSLSGPAQSLLYGYDWPGNVRQLENVISRAMVLSDSGTLEEGDFPFLLTNDNKAVSPLDFSYPSVGSPDVSISLVHEDGAFKTMEEIEQEVMRAVLAHCQENITKASEELGIAKSTFYRKMKNGTDAIH